MKGILSELWLSSTSHFVGNTNKQKKTSNWIYDINDPDYATFWDVSPRQLFLIFTNQMGLMKTGINIDRFTGDQVWNQPVAGYRILPIQEEDIGIQTVDGKNLHFVNLRMKIYWADDDVHVGHVSGKFDIQATTDADYGDQIPSDYTVRLLRFKLFFDQPVQISNDGRKILNSPRIVGKGLWSDQEKQSGIGDQGHPDFIWQPINPLIVNDGYANPYINWSNIQKLTALHGGSIDNDGEPNPPPVNPPPVNPPPVNPPEGGATAGTSVFKAVVDATNVYTGTNTLIAERLILKVFKRAGLNVDVKAADIEFDSGKVQFRLYAGEGVTKQAIIDAFTAVEVRVISIK